MEKSTRSTNYTKYIFLREASKCLFFSLVSLHRNQAGEIPYFSSQALYPFLPLFFILGQVKLRLCLPLRARIGRYRVRAPHGARNRTPSPLFLLLESKYMELFISEERNIPREASYPSLIQVHGDLHRHDNYCFPFIVKQNPEVGRYTNIFIIKGTL